MTWRIITPDNRSRIARSHLMAAGPAPVTACGLYVYRYFATELDTPAASTCTPVTCRRCARTEAHVKLFPGVQTGWLNAQTQ